jgi:hypothetical protein
MLSSLRSDTPAQGHAFLGKFEAAAPIG